MLKSLTLKIYSETLQIKMPEKTFANRPVYKLYICNSYIWYLKVWLIIPSIVFQNMSIYQAIIFLVLKTSIPTK